MAILQWYGLSIGGSDARQASCIAVSAAQISAISTGTYQTEGIHSTRDITVYPTIPCSRARTVITAQNLGFVQNCRTTLNVYPNTKAVFTANAIHFQLKGNFFAATNTMTATSAIPIAM